MNFHVVLQDFHLDRLAVLSSVASPLAGESWDFGAGPANSRGGF